MKPLSPRYTSMKFGWILALATVAIGIYFLIAGAGVPGETELTYSGYDTPSYYRDGLSIRPPLYPLLLRGSNFIFRENHYLVVGIIQMIVWGLASVAMWRIAVPRYGRWGIAIVTIYALLPPLVIWSVSRYVEAIAIPLMVFSALFLSEWLRRKKRRDIWLFFTTLILLLLTRPAFIFVVIATVLAAIPLLATKAKHKQGKRLILAGLTAILFTLIYSTFVYWRSGVFVPSVISVYNKYYMAREAGVLDPTLNPDSTQRKEIAHAMPDMQVGEPCKKGADIWGEIWLLRNKENGLLVYKTVPFWQIHKIKDQHLPFYSINQMVNRSISAHKEEYYKYVFDNAYRSLLTQPVISGGNDFPHLMLAPPMQNRFGHWQVSVGFTLATATIFLLVIFIALLCKPKKIASRIFLFWMVLCCLGNLATITLGAPYDHSRLFVESVPLFFLIVAAVGHSLSRHLRRDCIKT